MTAPNAPAAAPPGRAVAGRPGSIRNQIRIPAPPERLRVLLVEDDPGDAFLVRELLAEADAPVDLRTAQTMTQALRHLHEVHCVLLDLGLPDASGLEGLRQLLHSADGVAVLVLTGLEDEYLGIAAVGEGAQDYLVKGKVDGVLLSRALRYAVERKRADENVRRLREVELLQAESARLERGLLPKPIMDHSAVQLVSFYRSGRDRGLIGGDFYDAIATDPDRLHLLVGDVCGHGVDEAPLGVTLRVAWRALVLANVPDDTVLQSLEQVLVSERSSEELFATVAMVTVDLKAGLARVRLAGHPPPLLMTRSGVRRCDVPPALVLGVVTGAPRPATDITLDGDDWSLLIYTDGLIEGLAGPDGNRLGVDGLAELLTERALLDIPDTDLPAWLMGRAEELNGGALSDDVAVLLLTPGGSSGRGR